MKKVVVIGGYGNIGLGVTRQLLKEGYEVTVVTRHIESENPVPGTKRIQAYRKDRDSFKSVIKNEKCDYAIDFACYTLEDAQLDYEAFGDIKQILAVSSGAVYGPLYGCEIPIQEYMRKQPEWGYGMPEKVIQLPSFAPQ